VRARAPSTTTADSLALNALDDLAAVLSEPGAQVSRFLRTVTPTQITPVPAAPPPPPPRQRLSTAALLDSGIEAVELIASAPLAPRASIPEEEGLIVPIESLLYRGRAALDRAVDLRDAMRVAGPPNDPDALEELFDLLELARAD
jgi:hypothetical protein